MSLSKTLFGQTIQTLGWLLALILLGLFLDSEFVAKNYFEQSQWINNGLVVLVFAYFYINATARTREQLIYAVIIAIIGEYIFSIGLGMYTYRLQNIPHYVPPGHAVVFLSVYYFCRKPKVKFHRKQIEIFLTSLIAMYSLYFLILKGDVFGFILTALIFYVLRNHPNERLFYLTMYCMVACLEIAGTGFNCWKWPELAFDKFTWLPSANPPSGISFFYFGLDRGTMSIYKRRHKAVWKRFKQLAIIRET